MRNSQILFVMFFVATLATFTIFGCTSDMGVSTKQIDGDTVSLPVQNQPARITRFTVDETRLVQPDSVIIVTLRSDDPNGDQVFSSLELVPDRGARLELMNAEQTKVILSEPRPYNIVARVWDEEMAGESMSLTVQLFASAPVDTPDVETFVKVQVVSTEDQSSDINATVFIDPDNDDGGFFSISPSRIMEVEPGDHKFVANRKDFLPGEKTITVAEGDTTFVTIMLQPEPPPDPQLACEYYPINDVVIRIDGKQHERIRVINLAGRIRSMKLWVDYSELQSGQSQEIFRVKLTDVSSGKVYYSKFVSDDRGGLKEKEIEFAEAIPTGSYLVEVEHAAATDSSVTDAPSSLHFFGISFCYKK